MTPEETQAMADRIAQNRREAAATKTVKVKVVNKDKEDGKEIKVNRSKPTIKDGKAARAKATSKKLKPSERVKPIGPATKTFKFKDGPRSTAICDVLNCKAKPQTGFRCTKHRKLIRKAQLAANNIVWRQRVKDGEAGHHVVYTRPGEKKPIATKFSLKATDRALKVVSTGHSVIEKVGDFKEILARTKREVKA